MTVVYALVLGLAVIVSSLLIGYAVGYFISSVDLNDVFDDEDQDTVG